MLAKIKNNMVVLLLLLPVLAFVPQNDVVADHTISHCNEEFPNEGQPGRDPCLNGIPTSFSDWGEYCSRGNPVDSQYASCMQQNAGGETPPGSLDGSWCVASGRTIYYYDRATCPAGTTRTNDVPIVFNDTSGVWCAFNGGSEGVSTTFIVGGGCPQSSFTSPTSNPFPAGSRENPNGNIADQDTDDSFSGGSTGGGFGQNSNNAPGFVLDPNSAGALQTPEEIPTDTPIYAWLLTIVDFLNVGVSIVAAITVAISGYQYMASRGDPNKTAKAIQRLSQVGLAIVIYVLGWALLNWLVPGGALNTAAHNQGSYSQSIESNDTIRSFNV